MTDKKSTGEQLTQERQQAVTDFFARISRRRFTKMVGAAPLVMTLASRSVWGCTSGIISGNASRAAGSPPACGGTPGCTPSVWKKCPEHWAHGGIGRGTNFWCGTLVTDNHWHYRRKDISDDSWKGCKVLDRSTATPFSHCLSGVFGTDSCMDKLLHGSDNDLECQIVAACLNAENITGYPISVGGLQEAWEVCKNDPDLLQQLSDLLISVNTAPSIDGTAADIVEPGNYETKWRLTTSNAYSKPLVHGPTTGVHKWSKS